MSTPTFEHLHANWHPPITDADAPVRFQAIDWYPHDVRAAPPKAVSLMTYGEKQAYYNGTDPRVTFQMDVFGVGPEGETYTLKVGGFCPYFFVRLPDGTTDAEAKDIVRFLQQDDYFLSPSMKNEFDVDASCLEPYFAYHGYQFDKKHPFLKLVFHSDRARKKMSRQMEKGCKLPQGLIRGFNADPSQPKEKYYYFQLYESNVESLIRFFHDKRMNPCGWLELDANAYIALEQGSGESLAYCTLECEAAQVRASDSQQMAKTMICSFDIEADSSHGDFPLAVKDYTKPANELILVYLHFLDEQVDVKVHLLVTWLKHLFRLLDDRETKALTYKHPVEKDEDGNELPRRDDDPFALHNFSEVFPAHELTPATMPNFRALAVEIKTLFNEATSSDVYEGDTVNIHIPGDTHSKKDQVEAIRIMSGRSGLSQYDKEYFMKNNRKWVRLRDPDGVDDRRQWRIEREGGYVSYTHMSAHAWKKRKPRLLAKLVKLLTKALPEIRGDRVIQIGSVFQRFGEAKPCLKHLLALDSCDPIDDATVEWFDNEADLLVRWAELMREMSPHIVTGYNIFGFDYKFMWERADVLGVADAFGDLSQLPTYRTTLPHRRHRSSAEEKLLKPRKPGGAWQCRCDGMHCKLLEKELASAGLGENRLFYMDVPGMVQIDMCKDIMKDHNLSSYKLDDVASKFIHGKFTDVERDDDGATTVLWSDNNYGIQQGDYLYLYETTVIGEEPIEDGKKFRLASVTTVDGKHRFELTEPVVLAVGRKFEWGLGKDDVGPQDIFRMQYEGPAERATIGRYCLQDCALVLSLMMKLQTVSNNVGMASVCSVPFQYIFTRGQGVKTFSLVSRECARRDYRIPQRRADGIVPANLMLEEQDAIFENGFPQDKGEPPATKETYQGAFVLDPKPGIYLDEAIAVLDYSSLYPQSIISHNLCPSSIILDPEYQGEDGAKKLRAMGLDFRDVTYDNYLSVRKAGGSGNTYDRVRNTANPTTTCRFIKPKEGKILTKEGKTLRWGIVKDTDRGILPQTLQILLSQRQATREKLKKESDPFVKAVLDGLQLAYKVTANSIYGSLGAQTNPIFFKDIAASTTATGRDMLLFAKRFVTTHYPGSDIVYGDTDSIFIHFHPQKALEDGQTNALVQSSDVDELKGRDAIKESIRLGQEAGKRATANLRVLRYINHDGMATHELEYEKVLADFMLISKKRYLSFKYEKDPDEGKLNYMGIVLKRRDNANIVKIVYADIISVLMSEKNIALSIERLQSHIQRLLDHKVPLRDLIISKSLRSHYATPQQIVHKVLADRMADRDPGNKPQANDRIPYVYIDVGDKLITVQGDRVEHPDYIREHNLKPDALFYITNQISKPVSQIYGLVVEQLPGYKYASDPHYWQKKRRSYETDGKGHTKEWLDKKMTDMRVAMAEELLFGDYVREEQNRRNGSQSITRWFSSKAVEGKPDGAQAKAGGSGGSGGGGSGGGVGQRVEQGTLTQWFVKK